MSEKPETKSEPEKIAIKVASTEEGIDFLRFLMHRCGYQMPSVTQISTGDISITNTVYNESRRNLWLEIRKLIPEDKLILVEHEKAFKAKPEGKEEQCQTEQIPEHRTQVRQRPQAEQAPHKSAARRKPKPPQAP
jgi:hypothetical protein